MKWAQSFFIFISVINLVYAGPSCNELEKDLLGIEYKLQSSKLAMCDDVNQVFCRPSGSGGNKDLQKYYHEVVADYNKAMADIILAKGFHTISNTIEGSYNSIPALEEANLDKVESYINLLEENVQKAKILESVMDSIHSGNDGKVSFWVKSGFTPNDYTDVDIFSEKIASSCPKDSSIPLCKTLRTLPKEKLENSINFLRAYAQAEFQSRTSEQSDPTADYEIYQKSLLVKTEERGDYISVTEFEQLKLAEGTDLNKLKKQLQEFKNSKSNETAKDIFKLAKKLDKIQVGYSKNDDVESTMKGFLNSQFQDPLNNLEVDVTNNIVTDIWKNNFDNEKARTNNNINIRIQGLKDEALKAGFNACSELSSNEEYPKCLKTYCESNPTNESKCDNSKVNFFRGKIAGLNQAIEKNNELDKASQCFEKPTLAEKKECIIDFKKEFNLETDLDKLNKNLEKARKNLANYNSAMPFKELNLRKGLALNAIEDVCEDTDTVALEYSCKAGLGLNQDPEFFQLSGDLADISIEVDKNILEDAYADSDIDEEGFQSELFDQCSIGNPEFEHLCLYFKDQELMRIEKERADIQRQNRKEAAILTAEINRQNIRVQKRTAAGIFLKAFAGPLVGATPYLVGQYGSYKARKQWRDASLKGIEYQAQAREDYLNWYNDPDRINDNFASNFGQGFFNDGYYYNSIFQGDNSNSIYSNNTSPYSFSFDPGPTTSSTSNSSTFTGSGGYNFSF